ncbi:MAG TPA: GspH/FimT family pseudopilin [Armatimonadota bacterium]|jgi:type II secretion system protein H
MPILTTGSKRGFTLLELMVVMAIMALLCGVVMGSMGATLEEARLRSGARTALAALRYARSVAVSQRIPSEVTFDTQRRAIGVQVQNTADDGTTQWRALTTSAGKTRILPVGVEITSVRTSAGQESATPGAASDEQTGPAVTFTPLGQSVDACITLRNAKGHQLYLIMDAVTGRGEITDKEP